MTKALLATLLPYLLLAQTKSVLNLNPPTNSGVFTQTGTGAAVRTVQSKLTDVLNVKDFGAVGDGAADDTAAWQAAVNAIPAGGTLHAIPGATYLINTIRNYSSSNATQCSIVRASGIHINLDGATIKAGSSLPTSGTGGLFCLNLGLGMTYENQAGTTTYYPVRKVNRGDITISLITPSQASHFPSGDTIYIQGECVDLNNRGLNIVTSANSTTGVLALAFPVGKSYTTGGSTCVPATTTPVVADVQGFTGFDYSIENGTILPGTVQAIIVNQVTRFRLSHTTITTAVAYHEPIQMNYLMDALFDGNTVRSNGGPLIDMSGRSCTNCRAVGNTLELTPDSSGNAPTGGIVGAGEGSENATFVGNVMTSTGNNAAALNIGGYDSLVSSNIITVGSSSKGVAVNTSTATAPLISDNVINSAAQYGLYLAAVDQDIASGNRITVSGSSTVAGIYVIGRAVIFGGSVTGMTSHYGILITRNSAAMATQVIGVNIAAASYESKGAGIYVGDPGSQQAADPILTGNQITNYTTPIAFQNITHNANRVVLGNGGVANTSICSTRTNGTCGIVTLADGTYTVKTSAISVLASTAGGGVVVALALQNCVRCGSLYVGAVAAGQSFTINSTSKSDGSNVYWEIKVLN